MITVNFNPVSVDTNIALGNHMFQYCVCRLIAEKNGYEFYIPYGQYLAKVFPNLSFGSKDGEILNYYYEEANQKYNPSVFKISDFTNLNGYYQTDKYLIDNIDKIKSWFKIDIDDKTFEVIDKYPVDDFCYIHIRGGDYKSAQHFSLPIKYYLDAIDIIKSKFPELSFVVVTDDVEFSKSYFPDFDVISNDVVTDFKSLYFSKYLIIANSSFSWWSGWLSNKLITIAPSNWLNYNKPSLGYHPIDIKTDKFIFI
jgi:hypothetical protein